MRDFDKLSSEMHSLSSRACRGAMRKFAMAAICFSAISWFAHYANAQGEVSIGSGFNNPWGVAVDRNGNVFVADTGNSAVKEILAVGGYTTVKTLGSGFNSPKGVAVDGNGNVFVADTGNGAVKEILEAGGYTTIKTLETNWTPNPFPQPVAVTVDGSGNVYVADLTYESIAELPASGGYTAINTLGVFAGAPVGVAVDAFGNVFVANEGSTVLKISAGCQNSASCVSNLGSGFGIVYAVAVDWGNNVYVSSQNATGNGTLKEIVASGGYSSIKTLLPGNGPLGLSVALNGDVYLSYIGIPTITEIVAPGSTAGFSISGTAPNIAPGATTGNISTIAVTPAGGFTGSVALTAAITSSPAGAQYPPTLSFGTTSPVSITGTTAGTGILTISTTAATTAALDHPKRHGVPWYAAGGATLACLLFFGIPVRRRRWQTLLGLVVLLLVLTGGVLACSGGGGNSSGGGGGGGTTNPGTTAGTYTVTVTGTSSTTTGTGTITFTVE
jgi:hypothetical protein